MKATAQTNANVVAMPKNRTGLFAAERINQPGPRRHHPIKASSHSFVISPEQHHSSAGGTRQNSPLSSAKSRSPLINESLQKGFPPSVVRHHRLRLASARAQRSDTFHSTGESVPKPAFVQSHATVRLRSEIDQINSKLKHYDDLYRNSRIRSAQVSLIELTAST